DGRREGRVGDGRRVTARAAVVAGPVARSIGRPPGRVGPSALRGAATHGHGARSEARERAYSNTREPHDGTHTTCYSRDHAVRDRSRRGAHLLRGPLRDERRSVTGRGPRAGAGALLALLVRHAGATGRRGQ